MSEHQSKLSVNEKAPEGTITWEHGIKMDDTSIKGISRYLNSQTGRGRANVAKLTYGSLFGIFLYFKLRKYLPGHTQSEADIPLIVDNKTSAQGIS